MGHHLSTPPSTILMEKQLERRLVDKLRPILIRTRLRVEVLQDNQHVHLLLVDRLYPILILMPRAEPEVL